MHSLGLMRQGSSLLLGMLYSHSLSIPECVLCLSACLSLRALPLCVCVSVYELRAYYVLGKYFTN